MEENLFIQQLFETKINRSTHFPDKKAARNFINTLFEFLFASSGKKYSTQDNLSSAYEEIKLELSALLNVILCDKDIVKKQQTLFFNALPSIYDALLKDGKATYAFDPAATSFEEVCIAYPGFFATSVYRMAHQLYLQQIEILPRLLSEYAHSVTGIDIHPGATIGENFIIDHGTGIVIGETAFVGNDVKIYQSVTLGATNVLKSEAAVKRHPTIEDNVIIYAGATILGGQTIVGHGSIIGGNVWLTSSVPPYSIVYRNSDIKIRDNNPMPEGLNFVI
jgi:serine O-acetyltransferase